MIATYIDQNRSALVEIPSALFTVSASGALRDQDPGGFLEEFLRAVDWQPDLAAAFAGGEPFPRSGHMLRLAKLMTGHGAGGAAGATAYRTDWTDVRSFADAIATELAKAATVADRTEPHVANP
jgi:menaquinone-dependent protoporphyrinogen IX oxidase